LFTREEANRLLPRIDRILQRLQQVHAQLEEFKQKLRASATQVRTNGHPPPSPAPEMPDLVRANQLANEATLLMGQLSDLGVELKDIEQGLIDFLTEREGRIVYLCWKRGEPELQFWHELDAGFAGRQPLAP